MKVSDNKPHSVHLRLTDMQYEFCRDNAEIMGVGVSEFIRMTLNTLAVTSSRIADKVVGKTSKTLGDLENEDHQNYIEHSI